MNLLSRLSVRTSVAAFAAIALLAILALGGLSVVNMQRSQAMAQDVLGDVRLTHAQGEVDMLHDTLRSYVLTAQLAGPKAEAERKQTILKELAEHGDELQTHLGTLDREVDTEALRNALATTRPLLTAYVDGSRQLAEAALAGTATAAQIADWEKHFDALELQLAQLGELIGESAKSTVAGQERLFAESRWVLLGAIAVAATLLSAFGLLFVRTLLQRLGAEPTELREFTAHIADGALDGRFHALPAPDSVAGALLRMQGQLANVVGDVRQNAESVATASAQIAQGNLDLSGRTEEQASSLQQTAASMEELNTTVATNAEAARRASTLAQEASAVAGRGNATIGQVVDTMKGIDAAARQIAEIIGTIDGIAFQTNILAPNAAVEAARAGEQGRGFAVVAGEVRSLAQRAAAAAKEIKALVGNSLDRVEAGNTLVDEAGTTMREVSRSVERVTELMGQISAASAQQSAGVEQVGEAVGQIDKVTQQNAALVEESAAAADSLKRQAERLLETVAVFRLGAPAPAAAPMAAMAAVERPAAIAARVIATAAKPAPLPAAKPAAKPVVRKPAAAPAPTAAQDDGNWETF